MDPEALRKFIPDISASVAVSSLANNVQGLSNNLLAFEPLSYGLTIFKLRLIKIEIPSIIINLQIKHF